MYIDGYHIYVLALKLFFLNHALTNVLYNLYQDGQLIHIKLPCKSVSTCTGLRVLNSDDNMEIFNSMRI